MKKLFLVLVALALPHLTWGQLYFGTTLKGWNEVPQRATPAFGSGFASLDLDTNLFKYNFSFENLLGPQTGAHIHLGAKGVNGPIIFELPAGSPGAFETVLEAVHVEQLLAGLWYTNVHSTVYPGGEIRGQFVPVPEPSTYALSAVILLGLVVLGKRHLARLRHTA